MTETVEKPKVDEKSVRDMTKEEQKEMMKDMPPPDGYTKGIPEKPKEEPKVEPVEKKEPINAEKTQEEKKKEESESLLKIETALQHPHEKNDYTKNMTPVEWALYKQMRRDRKARQKAESDRDKALFNVTKMQAESEQKKVAPKEDDPFAGKDPNDFLTVEEAKKILTKPVPLKDEPKEQKPDVMQMRYLQMCEKEARREHADFDTVMELTSLLENDKDGLVDLKERVEQGENPALVMYDLIKNHKEFEESYSAAEIKAKAKKAAKEPIKTAEAPKVETPTPTDQAKVEEAKRAQEALEKNADGPKTTAHAASRESKPAGEMTLEDITSMSDLEFAKLPRKTREQYLKKFGA